MIELGQLERSHAEFERRGVKVYVISNDDLADSKKTQEKFPHLVVIADPDMAIANALQVVQKGANPHGGDANAPTTFLVDGSGIVRWLFRPSTVFERLAPDRLLAAVDENLLK